MSELHLSEAQLHVVVSPEIVQPLTVSAMVVASAPRVIVVPLPDVLKVVTQPTSPDWATAVFPEIEAQDPVSVVGTFFSTPSVPMMLEHT